MKNIIEKMKERGFSKIFETRNGNDDTVSISFVYEPKEEDNKKLRFPIPMYNVTVWVDTLEFQFMYAVPTSINKLMSPKCSSFMNDEHFDRLALKFERDIAVLNKYCS